MENHPIPQDVTGFQFKLIGDMTIKQFIYLASGVILGWISLSIPIPVILRIPFGLIFFSFGLSFAFLPIEGRPLDVMINNLIKALFAPNQYLYQKTGKQLIPYAVAAAPAHAVRPVSHDSSEKLQVFLSTLPKTSKNKLDEKEAAFFNSLDLFGNIASQSAKPQILLMQEEKQKLQEEKLKKPEQIKETLEKEAILLKKELQETKLQEQKAPVVSADVHQKTLELEKQLQEVLYQKEGLQRQLMSLQKTLETSKQKVYAPSTLQPTTQTQNVRKVSKSMIKSVGMPTMPDVPNIITGIVKDPRGNVLPNILVEIKDKEENPVRAFKTNGLGQFASATPLLNGVYTIIFEDPEDKHTFDAVELIINGQILEPLEVISQDKREELRRALFS